MLVTGRRELAIAGGGIVVIAALIVLGGGPREPAKPAAPPDVVAAAPPAVPTAAARRLTPSVTLRGHGATAPAGGADQTVPAVHAREQTTTVSPRTLRLVWSPTENTRNASSRSTTRVV